MPKPLLKLYIRSLKKSIDYLSLNKGFFYFITILLVISVFIGVLMPDFVQHLILKQLADYVNHVTGGTNNPSKLFLVILLNNLKVNLYVILLGIFLGVTSIAVIAVNGIALGVLASLIIKSSGFKTCTLMILLAGILPHGVLEIPAFLISATIGFRIGVAWIYPTNGPFKKRLASVAQQLRYGLEAYILVVSLLIILAALIESFLTPSLLFLTASHCGINIKTMLLNST